MKNFREIELLSSYLDEQLNTSEAAQLESRLPSDPELVSVLNDLRAARDILHKLPARKTPRNFVLTRKMVGLKPPLPRSYPIFRFSTAVATTLLAISFAANLLTPQIRFAASAPQALYGIGSGGGCGEPCGGDTAAAEAPATEAPLLELAPAPSAGNATAREGEPSADAMQMPTKRAEPESVAAEQPPAWNEAFVPLLWQIVLLVIILLSSLLMWFMRLSALRKWR
ncbi:MAG: anti-sigma factor family protein [Anaerolineales bacterium]